MICKFTTDLSIDTVAAGFRVYGSAGGVERYRLLDDVDHTTEAVNLDNGLVHLFGRTAVYEIRFDAQSTFVVSKLAERW